MPYYIQTLIVDQLYKIECNVYKFIGKKNDLYYFFKMQETPWFELEEVEMVAFTINEIHYIRRY